MIMYIGGKLIKDLSELVEGEMYCIGGIGGVFTRTSNQCGNECFQFKASKEGSVLVLDRQALEDRIQQKVVRRMLRQSKASDKTVQKLLKK